MKKLVLISLAILLLGKLNSQPFPGGTQITSSVESDLHYILNQNGTYQWEVGTNNGGNGTGNNQFFIYDNDFRFTVQRGTGFIGIGTRTPTQRLEVNGNIKGAEGESSIFGFKNIFGRSTDGILHLRGGTSNGPVFINYYESGPVSIANGGGYVGIGTSTPEYKLSIEGNSSSDLGICIKNNIYSGNQGKLLLFKSQNSYAVTDQRNAGVLESYNDLILSAAVGEGVTNSCIKFQTGRTSIVGNTRMIIDKDGNVGVGTNTPGAKLMVNGTLGIMGEGLDGSTYQRTIIYSDINNGLHFDAPLKPDGTKLPINFGWRGSSALFTMLGNGNFGIGTTNPQNKLDVNGTIHAREVKIDVNGWPDFVFSPTYKLRTLPELEQFVKTNNHLPEIPSATEMQKEGVSVSDMQTKLLQKVEELTLYMIELKKENEQLKSENMTIKSEIEKLKTK